MMKKLLLLAAAMFVFNFSARSQVMIPADTTICDVLHYYFNKFHFKTGTALDSFNYYKSAASTVTTVTHCGSRFENFVEGNDTLTVTGLEAFASKHPKTPSVIIKVHLYLCKLDVNKMPVLPALDSVIATVNSTVVTNIGGPLIHGPRKIAGDFAVLFRNASTIAGDTVRLLRTAGTTFTSNTALSKRNSDSYGYIRFGGQFTTTTNYTKSQGFGYATDYEFCVAPRVCYRLVSGHSKPDAVNNGDSICVFTPLVFTNTSSRRYTHRQYNLNEFCTFWNLYAPFVAAPQVSGGWSGDSAITWKFESEDATDGRVFLGYGGRPQLGTNGAPHTITFASDSVNPDLSCFTANQFRGRLRPMAIYGNQPQYVYNEDFTLCFIYCNGTTLSVGKQNPLDKIKLFPNPVDDGTVRIKGLTGKTHIVIYDMLGQMVYSETTDRESAELNLQAQPAGSYIVRISNATDSKVIKLIRN